MELDMFIRNVKVVFKNGDRLSFVSITPTLEDFFQIIHDYEVRSDVCSVSFEKEVSNV